jgi:hypothetical protein
MGFRIGLEAVRKQEEGATTSLQTGVSCMILEVIGCAESENSTDTIQSRYPCHSAILLVGVLLLPMRAALSAV